MNPNYKVEVKYRPVNFRGDPHGIGSVIDCGNKTDHGAMLAGGCIAADRNADTKKVSLASKKAPAKKAAKSEG